MPREARVVCVGVPYHVTQRGNFRMNIFEEDVDREKYLEFFLMYKAEFGVKVYAWCLMSNHVHFIVEPSTERGLADLFKFTHMRYSQYFNKKRGVVGHLWQGRFFSSALDSDHLYEALRYVELNPLRAGIVNRIDGYVWSSMKEHLTGKGKLRLDDVSEHIEIEDWRAYLREKADEELVNNIRKKTKVGKPLGDSKFIKRIEKLTGRSFSLGKGGRPKKVVK